MSHKVVLLLNACGYSIIRTEAAITLTIEILSPENEVNNGNIKKAIYARAVARKIFLRRDMKDLIYLLLFD